MDNTQGGALERPVRGVCSIYIWHGQSVGECAEARPITTKSWCLVAWCSVFDELKHSHLQLEKTCHHCPGVVSGAFPANDIRVHVLDWHLELPITDSTLQRCQLIPQKASMSVTWWAGRAQRRYCWGGLKYRYEMLRVVAGRFPVAFRDLISPCARISFFRPQAVWLRNVYTFCHSWICNPRSFRSPHGFHLQ